MMPAGTLPPLAVPDRLLLTLPGAVAAARAHCEPGCFPYHAAWRLCRRAGLKGHPGWHTGFYAQTLDKHPLPTHRPVRVLICAASDEMMLAVLARLVGARRLLVTLIDACRTPLLLAATYAHHHHHIAVTTVQARAPERLTRRPSHPDGASARDLYAAGADPKPAIWAASRGQ
jgi:hypothetical protein